MSWWGKIKCTGRIKDADGKSQELYRQMPQDCLVKVPVTYAAETRLNFQVAEAAVAAAATFVAMHPITAHGLQTLERQHHACTESDMTTLHDCAYPSLRFKYPRDNRRLTRQQTIIQNAPRRRPRRRTYPILSIPQHNTNTPQLISQCTSHFKIGNDTASLARIKDSLNTLGTFRTQQLSSLSADLSALSRTHQTLSANHNHTVAQHNAVDHASEILRLDTEKFKIAKQASDLEIEGERLAAELNRLGSVAADLEEEGVEGGVVERPGEDATV